MNIWVNINKVFIIFIMIFSLSCVKNEKVDTYYIYKGFDNYPISENLLIHIELMDESKAYIENMKNINILCTIVNISFFSEIITVSNVESLNPPNAFFINIKDKHGNILANEFSVNLLSSEIYRENEVPWKKEILYPMEKKIVHINLVNIMGNNFVKKMKKGKYFINIVYIVFDKNNEDNRKYLSNVLEIKI